MKKVKMTDSPLFYLALYYYISKFAYLLLILQIVNYFLFYPTATFSLTFYLSWIILWLMDNYLFSYLTTMKFDYRKHLQELD